MFLRKSNATIAIAIVVKVYNIAIKFETMGKSKAFLFFSYKLSAFKLYLLFFSKTFIFFYKKYIISLQANNAKRFLAIEKAEIVS